MTFFFELNGVKEISAVSLQYYCWTFLKSSIISDIKGFHFYLRIQKRIFTKT